MTHHDVGGNADSPKPERAPSDRDGNAGGSASAALPRRKLVLFADGTGNAFTTQESSVWRLYEALDHTQPDQIAHYIKGVGTAGWAPLAALDGATGVGVPGNVRKLYRFLCWNWRPGDDIYIFGFSRGSFTARTLAALISSQGLVPAEIDDTPVSHAEMGRNVKAAWREYRRETVPWTKSLPTIWVTRWIRDFLLFVYHWLCRHRSYAEVRGKMNGRSEVEIAFLGLFDTVEAFGVPVEELRLAVDWAIWPISFRNHRLSHKVRHACHALALDDERTTFHPLRIDQSHLAQGQIVKEVWFTGVHSDIGGGYPESSLSFVPLVWMVEQLGDRLRFQDGEIEHFREYQSALGPRHDSRSGAAVLYRYGPRPILGGDVNGGLPVVHFAVIERMLLGCDDYAPIMLPANCLVLLPDGTRLPLRSEGETKDIDEQHAREALKAAYLAKATGPRREQEAKAFTAMSTPDATMSSLTRDTVWWRRVAYFSLLFMAGVIAAWPWIAHALVQWSEDRALEGTGALSFITNIDWVMGAVVAPLTNLLRDVLPSYAAPWLNIATYYPFLTSIVVIVTWWIWHKNGTLRDDIEERARLAWNTSRRRASMKHIDKPGPLMRFGHWMRLNASPAQRVITRGLVPAVFLIAIFGSAALIVSSSLFTGRLALGSVCSPPTVKGSAAFQTGTPVNGRAGRRARAVRHQGLLLVERARRREGPQIPRLSRDQRTMVRPHHHERSERICDLRAAPLRGAAGASSVRGGLVPARGARRQQRHQRPAAQGGQCDAGRRISPPPEAHPARGGRHQQEPQQVPRAARRHGRVQGQARRPRQIRTDSAGHARRGRPGLDEAAVDRPRRRRIRGARVRRAVLLRQ
ncbi:DUF2235 domain-containing protein [Bradyrhizobium ottawaense]|uniref:DUF2235 domain-containing protein n=1 Tax=Bradyrhizobium ottawaense TaxID=931866 RepID=UPI00339B0E80